MWRCEECDGSEQCDDSEQCDGNEDYGGGGDVHAPKPSILPNTPVFYHYVSGNESRRSILVNLPGLPIFAIVCVQHIKDWEEATFANS